jgi:hypothetical protein
MMKQVGHKAAMRLNAMDGRRSVNGLLRSSTTPWTYRSMNPITTFHHQSSQQQQQQRSLSIASIWSTIMGVTDPSKLPSSVTPTVPRLPSDLMSQPPVMPPQPAVDMVRCYSHILHIDFDMFVNVCDIHSHQVI